MSVEPICAPQPLSEDERAAMLRYVASIKKQLQEVSELFGTRYGKTNSLADLSAKALVVRPCSKTTCCIRKSRRKRKTSRTKNRL